MIGFYTPRNEDELLYSSSARTYCLLYPDRSTRHFSKRLLGHEFRTFGGLLPNNVEPMLVNLPEVCGVTMNDAFDGSPYHVLAPLAEGMQLKRLRDSIGSTGLGQRNSIKNRYLAYCLDCAKEDAEAGRTPYWHVHPNLPGVNCCDRHFHFLVVTNARLKTGVLHDPSKWIDLKAARPARATEAEIRVAADIRWLKNQKSKFAPGARCLVATLRRLLIDRRPELGIRVKLNSLRILETIIKCFGDAFIRLVPEFYARCSWSKHQIVLRPSQNPIQLYSLLGQIGGISFQELFSEACNPFIPSSAGSEKPLLLRTALTIERSVREIGRRLEENPNLSRWELRKLDLNSVQYLSVHNRALLEKLMPKRRPGGRRVDWKARDEKTCAKIALASQRFEYRTKVAPSTLLADAGLPRLSLDRAYGRMPRTTALLRSMQRKPFERGTLALAKAGLQKLVENHAGASRANLHRINKKLTRYVYIRDKNFYESVMPFPLIGTGRRARALWRIRDQEMRVNLAAKFGALPLAVTVSCLRASKALRLRDQLCGRRSFRFPKAVRALKRLVKQAKAKARKRRVKRSPN